MFASAIGIPTPPQVFQTYLLPTLPFRRRRKESTETIDVVSTASLPSSPSADESSPPGSISSGTPTTPLSPQSLSPSDFGSPNFSPFPHSSIGSSIESTSPGMTGYTTATSTTTTVRRPSYLSGATSHISCSRCHADLALTSQIISKGFTGRHGRAYLVAASPCPLNSTPSTPGSVGLANSPSGFLPNTHTHKAVPRHLVTGLHTVCDISCAMCGSVLGWKYVGAEEETQRYKVGKFILETRRVTVRCCWENNGIDDDDEDNEDLDDPDGDGVSGWRYDLESRRMSNVRREHRRTSSTGGASFGLGGLGLGLGLGFGSAGSGADKQPSLQEEDDDNEEVMFDSQDEDECEDLFAGIWSPQLARRRRGRKLSIR